MTNTRSPIRRATNRRHQCGACPHDVRKSVRIEPRRKKLCPVYQVHRIPDIAGFFCQRLSPSSYHSDTFCQNEVEMDETCNLQSIHRLSAKLPWASTILSCTTPAIRSNVSIFCVKHLKRIDLSCNNRINVCVKVGLKAPGYKDCARV